LSPSGRGRYEGSPQKPLRGTTTGFPVFGAGVLLAFLQGGGGHVNAPVLAIHPLGGIVDGVPVVRAAYESTGVRPAGELEHLFVVDRGTFERDMPVARILGPLDRVDAHPRLENRHRRRRGGGSMRRAGFRPLR